MVGGVVASLDIGWLAGRSVGRPVRCMRSSCVRVKSLCVCACKDNVGVCCARARACAWVWVLVYAFVCVSDRL